MESGVNWRVNLFLWAGFLITLAAFLSYYLLFVRLPQTRDFPWVNWFLFVVGLHFIVVGLRRAFRRPQEYRGRVGGSIVAVLAVLIIGLFGIFNLYLSKQLPHSSEAPRVGQKAPNFALPDRNDNPVSLADLLATPVPGQASGTKPHGVLLVFYRGYW